MAPLLDQRPRRVEALHGEAPVGLRVLGGHGPRRGEGGIKPSSAYRFRIFCARFRRRIFFLRHFHRMLPRFFQAREDRFMNAPR